MKKLLFILIAVALFGCHGKVEQLRADRVMGPTQGEWTDTPTVLIHSSVSKELSDRIVKELSELEKQTNCGTWQVRQATLEEELQREYGKITPNIVFVVVEPPIVPVPTATQLFYYKGTTDVAYAEISLQKDSTEVVVRHELVHALAAVGDIMNGDPHLLMVINNVPEGIPGVYHDMSDKSKEPIDKVSELLPAEKQRLCKTLSLSKW